MKNNIIHIDIDAFFAQVEEIDNPSLKGKAVAVGGLSNRGIITTANYEARKYGIHSAMPIFIAKNLCPHLIMVESNMAKYKKKSQEVFSIVDKISKVVERVSIDECYVDIAHLKNPVDEVFALKGRIYEQTGLTVSIGMSYNKFLAKIASDWNKPNGFMIIVRDDMPEILYKLDIKKVHGLGEISQNKLRNIGVNTVEDLMELSEELLEDMFGKLGLEIYERIRGNDNRVVKPDRIRKSLGVERTFLDTGDKKLLLEYLEKYSKRLYEDLKKSNLGFRTLSIKFKNSNFKVSTHSKTFSYTIKDYDEILSLSNSMFNEHYDNKKLRLMGLTASNLVNLDVLQLSFDDLLKK
ncbi:DNA polymerase IV [Peptoniphilus sp. ING2-D1G]|nr:DNA polymerase IV [Peptoniphilus sp. ING2-D1G]